MRRAGMSLVWRRGWKEFRVLLTFSLPAVLASAIHVGTCWLGIIMLVRQPDGYSEMGIFNAAFQWRSAVMFLPIAMSRPFLAVLANLFGNGRIGMYRKTLGLCIVMVVTAALIPAIAIALASGKIMAAYGEGFSQGTLTLRIMAFAIVGEAVLQCFGAAIITLANLWPDVYLRLWWSCVFLTSFVFLGHHGAVGLALSYLMAYIANIVATGGYVLILLKRMPTTSASELQTDGRQCGSGTTEVHMQ